MTVLFVLATLVVFLTADHFVQKSRLAKVALATEAAVNPETFMQLPADINLAANHMWVKRDPAGVVTIGLDEFLSRLIGSVENIMLPGVGASFVPATTNITLKHGTKSLAIASPVGGKVVEVNEELGRNPSLMRNDPYGQGWIMKLQAPESGSLSGMFRGSEAVAWLKKQSTLAKEFLLGAMPPARFATMQDGGMPAEGALKNYDQDVWEEFARRFASLRPTN